MTLSSLLKPSAKPMTLRATGAGVNTIDILPPSKTGCLSLYISYNSISSLENITQFKNLKSLLMDFNEISRIEDLKPLSTLKNLSVLHLEGNPVCNLPLWDLHLLSLCPKLRVLNGQKTKDFLYSQSQIHHFLELESKFYQFIISSKYVIKVLKLKIVNPDIELSIAAKVTRRTMFKDPDYESKFADSLRLRCSKVSVDGYFSMLRRNLLSQHQKISELSKTAQIQLKSHSILLEQIKLYTDFDAFLEMMQDLHDASLQVIGIGDGPLVIIQQKQDQIVQTRTMKTRSVFSSKSSRSHLRNGSTFEEQSIYSKDDFSPNQKRPNSRASNKQNPENENFENIENFEELEILIEAEEEEELNQNPVEKSEIKASLLSESGSQLDIEVIKKDEINHQPSEDDLSKSGNSIANIKAPEIAYSETYAPKKKILKKNADNGNFSEPPDTPETRLRAEKSKEEFKANSKNRIQDINQINEEEEENFELNDELHLLDEEEENFELNGELNFLDEEEEEKNETNEEAANFNTGLNDAKNSNELDSSKNEEEDLKETNKNNDEENPLTNQAQIPEADQNPDEDQPNAQQDFQQLVEVAEMNENREENQQDFQHQVEVAEMSENREENQQDFQHQVEVAEMNENREENQQDFQQQVEVAEMSENREENQTNQKLENELQHQEEMNKNSEGNQADDQLAADNQSEEVKPKSEENQNQQQEDLEKNDNLDEMPEEEEKSAEAKTIQNILEEEEEEMNSGKNDPNEENAKKEESYNVKKRTKRSRNKSDKVISDGDTDYAQSLSDSEIAQPRKKEELSQSEEPFIFEQSKSKSSFKSIEENDLSSSNANRGIKTKIVSKNINETEKVGKNRKMPLSISNPNINEKELIDKNMDNPSSCYFDASSDKSSDFMDIPHKIVKVNFIPFDPLHIAFSRWKSKFKQRVNQKDKEFEDFINLHIQLNESILSIKKEKKIQSRLACRSETERGDQLRQIALKQELKRKVEHQKGINRALQKRLDQYISENQSLQGFLEDSNYAYSVSAHSSRSMSVKPKRKKKDTLTEQYCKMLREKK